MIDVDADRGWTRALVFAAGIFLLPGSGAAGEQTALEVFRRDYEATVQPLLRRFCYECHADDVTEADVDFAAFRTFADLRRQTKTWLKVREMLDSGQMPPREARQPDDRQRAALREWVRDFLQYEAKAQAGDPGTLLLRRLSNAEYTYTVRDLTAVDVLDPTREFPVDGAAGEGFINTGSAQGMSPALVQKYLDAAKSVADHVVLLPNGIRFSDHTTRRDQTDELVARIQSFYRRFTAEGGGTAVNLQGIQFDTNQDGRLPLERYLAVTLSERDALSTGRETVAAVAHRWSLNTKYLSALWNTFSTQTGSSPSMLIDDIREKWRRASPEDAARLAADISRHQETLWQFNAIGHIGREGRPKVWMEPVSPLVSQRQFSLKLPASDGDISASLVASDGGDGNQHDYVVWEHPRLVADGKPDLALRDLAGLQDNIQQLKKAVLSKTTAYLAAAAEIGAHGPDADVNLDEVSARYDLRVEALEAWLDYLAISAAEPVVVGGHFSEKYSSSNYPLVSGWGSPDTPSIIGNASDQEVRIPGIARPHSVVAHPSPTLFVAVGWSSPTSGLVRVEARLADAHPECGNGQEWILQHRTSRKVGNLWQGEFATGGSAVMSPKVISVREGELVSLILGPRAGNHACDLTEINLVIAEVGNMRRSWDLAKDVADDMQEANPHADGHGHAETWHFYQGEMASVDREGGELVAVPAGSLLASWQAARDPRERSEWAEQVRKLVTGHPPPDANSPDAVLYRQLERLAWSAHDTEALLVDARSDDRFGRHPLGQAIKSSDLVVQAPAVVRFRIPAELAEGRTLVANGRLDSEAGYEGSVQLDVVTGDVTSDELTLQTPVIVNDQSDARRRVESALAEFRNLFPPALCYARIVPVDEVVTLTLFYRQDEHLRRLMLNERQSAELERLWEELLYVSQEPLEYQVAFEQIREFATQDRPDLVKVWAPLVESVDQRASAFRQRLSDTEPAHVRAVLEFAESAWRRPLSAADQRNLRDFYRQLRDDEISHDEAVRLTLARVLASPAFLYKLEKPAAGPGPAPVTDLELATRLSYFLWSSLPDDELRVAAEAGSLQSDEVLLAEMRRMLRDERVRRLAIQFACQWLHVRDFDTNDDKNERLYPEFAGLRREMYEETILFFTDMFRNDGSILDLVDADHTFVNAALSAHYGIEGVVGQDWVRIDDVQSKGRGGILGMATFLASQSGASRTSPILRGNWVYETLLGERLPRPPSSVPQLPEEVPEGLTARELIERHSSVQACAKCHARIDPYGFALEQYDAIGRLRRHQVDTRTTLPDGNRIEGIDGLRDYLVRQRRGDVLRQFCRKLLGYALGREVQLSDELLLKEIEARLEANAYRFSLAVESIVTSPQFRQIRGE